MQRRTKKNINWRPNPERDGHPISLESKIDVVYISESQCNAMNKRHHTFIEKKAIYIDKVNSVMYMNSKSLQSVKKVIEFALPILTKKIERNISTCNTFFLLKTIKYIQCLALDLFRSSSLL